MNKVVWTMAVAVLALVCVTATDASAQGRHNKAAKRAAHALQKMDKNNDKVITRDEWTRKAKAFDRLDSNHDGKVTPDELAAARATRHRRH